MGQLVLPGVAQQADFSIEFEPCVGGAAFGQLANQLAALFQLALVRQNGGAPDLRSCQVRRAVDPAQPVFRCCVVFALFGQLRQGQVGLCQAVPAFTLRRLLPGQRDVVLQRGLCLGELVVLQLKGTQNQPAFKEIRFFAGHDLQLGSRFRIALQVQQGTRISQPHFRPGSGIGREVFAHQVFRFGLPERHQFQCDQRRAFSAGIGGLAALGRKQRAGPVARAQSHASHGRPGGAGGCRIVQFIGQRLFNNRCGQFFIADTGVGARHRRHHGCALRIGRQPELGLERLGRVGDPVQGNQDLQLIAVGLARVRLRLLPGLGGLQCRVARARLQRDVGGPLVQLGVTGFPGCVEHQRETRGGFAVLQSQFAQKQLIEQGAVEQRSGRGLDCHLRLGKAGRRVGCRRCGLSHNPGSGEPQAGKNQAKFVLHQAMIIEATKPRPCIDIRLVLMSRFADVFC